MQRKIQSVKGTRDFYPQQMSLRNYVYDRARAASRVFGYQEWDGPFIESLELYAARSGDELVKKQSFVFEDRGGDVVALRPELTPSLARMIAAQQSELTFPARWWSFGPFWRYEQPQRGRSREFFQWNIDMLGVDSPEADAEIIAVAATFLGSVKLDPKQAAILVNNRRLMDSQFDRIQIPAERRLEVSNLVDRRGKMDPEKWEAQATEMGLSAKQLGALKDLLSNSDLWKQSTELVRLFAALEALGVREYVRFDPAIVRGLMYYTGTVFEAYATTGTLKRAIFGGGRYDNLLAEVGGQPLSGVGFAMGDVVITLVLEEAGLLPEFDLTPAALLVTAFDESLLLRSFELGAELRAAGLNAIVYPEPAKLQKQFKFADKMKLRFAITIGPDEITSRSAAIKDLETGEQEVVPRAVLVETLRRKLANA